MITYLPESHRLVAFLGASLVLAVVPGPGVVYIVARSVAQGPRLGLASVAGVAMGNLGNALGAAVGLAALFAVFSSAFLVVKWLGTGYLVYLGVRTLRRPAEIPGTGRPRPMPASEALRDGFLVALLNPKTAIFFAAFLPQFMSAGIRPLVQAALLGGLFVAIAAITDSIYAVTAGFVSLRMSQSAIARRGGRMLAGGTLVGLGILSAWAGHGGRR
jgi:threonine/homoserine/homoserine lactone efflux protein